MKLSVLLISTFLLTPFGVAGGTLQGSFSPSPGNVADSHIETKNETVLKESNETLSQSLHKTNETAMNVSNETVSQSLHMTNETVVNVSNETLSHSLYQANETAVTVKKKTKPSEGSELSTGSKSSKSSTKLSKSSRGSKKSKQSGTAILVSVEALVSGTTSTAPFEQILAIADIMEGTLVTGESFFLPPDASTRPLVQTTFSVSIQGEDITEVLYALENLSTELRQANVIRVTGTKGGRRLQDASERKITFTLELTDCPSVCGKAILTDEDREAAVVANVAIEELELALLFSGYCFPPTSTCVCTGGFGGARCDVKCAEIMVDTDCSTTESCAWCNTTDRCVTSSEYLENVARTEDEVIPCPSCTDLSGDEFACSFSDICDYCSSSRICFDANDPTSLCAFAIVASSPESGELDVAVTRETVLSFSEPVLSSTVDESSVIVESQGRVLGTTVIHVNSGGTDVTIFYTENLPANSRVVVRVTSAVTSIAGTNIVPFELSFTTLGLLPVANTYVCGRVFASGFKTLSENNSSLVETPLVGATITVDGTEEMINAVTGADGAFVLGPTPSGTFFVHIDGRTSSQGEVIGGSGAYFPFVGKSWTAVAGKMNNQETIYLPLVSAGALTELSETDVTVVEFTSDVIDDNPAFAGVSIRVPPGALIDPANLAGTDNRMVGIAPVPPDRLPGQLPETLRFPVVITVQTVGGSNFDEPVPVCFPNLPDPTTDEVLAPGESTSLWSFNHDTGRFEIVSPATVNADGLLVCSDAGFGIVAPGWHGVAPGTETDGPEDQEECETGNECCTGGPNAGTPNPPSKGTFGQVLDAWGSVDVVKGCLETAFASSIINQGYKCGSAVYNFASDVIRTTGGLVDSEPGSLGPIDVFSIAGSWVGGLFGAAKACAGTAGKFFPWTNAVSTALASYKCGRGAQQALDKGLCQPDNAGACGEGPSPSTFCAANDALENTLDTIDKIINIFDPIFQRRTLVEFRDAVTEEETETFLMDQFFPDAVQFERVRTVERIIDGFEALRNATQSGMDENELLAAYTEYAADMEVLRDALQVIVLDLYRPMLDLAERNLDFIDSINDFSVIRAQFSSGGEKSQRELYIYIETEDDDIFRLKTTPTGAIIGLSLPPRRDFFYYAYSVQENLFGFAQGTTSNNGAPTVLPDIGLLVASDELLDDTDGDGLCDLCEFTIGTSPDLADSDGDGSGDLQELLAGTNPLDGLALTTGVVSIVPLVSNRANPTFVELSGSFLFMTMEGGGVAVYNVFNALQPALVGLLGSEFDFVEVSADANRLLARTAENELMLFSGTEFSDMLQLTDLYPRLLNIEVSSIHMSSEFAFVGTRLGRLLVFVSDFGSFVQSLDTLLSREINALALTPLGTITCVVDSALVFFEPSQEGVALWRSTPTLGSIQSSRSHTLQVATSIAYTASFNGGLDLVSTTGESVGSNSALPTPTLDLVVTEEGGGDVSILVVDGIEVWNIDNPDSPNFVARFDVDGVVRRPVLASGGGFLYLGTSNGLVVVNTNPADVFLNAPTIAKLGLAYRGIELTSGGIVEERSVLNIYAEATDDVGIRNVVFYANDAQLKIDSSFPFSATVSVPPFNASESLLVSAIAWDTAGNMAEEANVTLLVMEDTVAPSALTTFPAANSSIAFEEDETEIRIVIKYSEPLNTTLDQEKFSIQQLRPIIRDVNASLMRLVLQSGLGEVAVSIPVSELGLGQYRVEVDQGFAFDVNGNPSEIVAWEFNVTVASNVRTAIAVIDESDDSQTYVDARWAEFRAIYPDRPFCLLQPRGDFGFLNIPEVFDGIYSVVNRDNGNPALASDWFTICELNEINPLIRKIGLFVDNSGSMTIGTVQASLNLFLTKVEEANFETLSVSTANERWIDVFLVELQ